MAVFMPMPAADTPMRVISSDSNGKDSDKPMPTKAINAMAVAIEPIGVA